MLITSGSNLYLKKSLISLIQSLSDETIQKINSTRGIDEDTTKEIDELILSAFPYLVIKKEVSKVTF